MNWSVGSPPISCCGTPELREGLQCLEQVGDAPQAAGEPGCHAAQDTLGLLVQASAFSGRGMVEGIPLAGGSPALLVERKQSESCDPVGSKRSFGQPCLLLPVRDRGGAKIDKGAALQDVAAPHWP